VKELNDFKLIEAKDVRKYYKVHGVVNKELAKSSRGVALCKALDGVTLDIKPKEVLALVGESGCGKTTLAKILLGLEEVTSGTIVFRRNDLKTMNKRERNQYKMSVQAVFQNPYSSLDPRMRVRELISEPVIFGRKLTMKEKEKRVADLLEKVGLPSSAMNFYPHEFSGGQRQRIAIARSLWADPELIILDEPVSGLDVSIRAQILNLLRDLAEESSTSYLFISHDLATVKYMSHRVAIMYLGKLVEVGPVKEILASPCHPYTRAILQASLPSRLDDGRDESIIIGEISSPINVPPGCSFHPRCQQAEDVCRTVVPKLMTISPDHLVACNKF